MGHFDMSLSNWRYHQTNQQFLGLFFMICNLRSFAWKTLTADIFQETRKVAKARLLEVRMLKLWSKKVIHSSQKERNVSKCFQDQFLTWNYIRAPAGTDQWKHFKQNKTKCQSLPEREGTTCHKPIKYVEYFDGKNDMPCL